MENIAPHISSILENLPNNPGVYQFFDNHDSIIYVGKAKSLKNRVRSYFQNTAQLNGKTQILVKRIADIKYIVVETEMDALLLENSLIKKYQPRYNVMLKDDKTYPWICIKNERFPRVFSTRNVIRDGSKYFGPYASGKMMHTVLELIRQLYPLRNCNLALSHENISKKKFRVCLEYHIGNCKGPCEAYQTETEYNQSISEIKEILKGNINGIIRELKIKMKQYSEELEFEKAHAIKEKLEALENYQGKSAVVNTSIDNVDVFSIISDEKSGYVNYLKVIAGAVVQSHTLELKKKLDEPDEELLQIAVTELRGRFESDAKEVLLPAEVSFQIPQSEIIIPKIGDKKKLIELSERNVKYYQFEKKKRAEKTDPERHTKRILEQLKKDLRLTELPVHIECFDNSNFQGDAAVGACVVFKNAKPSVKDYRHFNIKTVEGPNDFASMEEVVYRRYKRMLEENQSLPQLIVIDGGKGQLSSALSSIEKLQLKGKIAIIGIAKKLEEIYFPEDTLPLYIDKKSESLRVIQHIRNEAHRFGITHHRQKREKETVKSELAEIKGIGFHTAQKLLWKFKSVKRVKEATEEELALVIGKKKAEMLYSFFHKKQ